MSLEGIEPPFSALRGPSDLAFGEYLAAQGDYPRAYDQFMGFAGQHPDHPLQARARLRAGICLQKTDRWEDSERLFQELSSRGFADPFGAEEIYQMAVSQQLAGRADQAMRTSAALLETPLRDRVFLLNGWAHLRRGHWQLARETLDRLGVPMPEDIARPAEAMKVRAARAAHLPHRSSALAALFSTLLPGSGKWYAGRFNDGLYSLLLVSSSAAVAASYGRDDQWTKAGLFGALGLFFYVGNIYGSALEAGRFNRDRREELLSDLEREAHVGSWLWDAHLPQVPAKDSAATRSSFGLAQDPTVTRSSVSLADTLFQEGQFDKAITEYRRQLFLFPENPGRDRVRYRIGLAHLNSGQWLGAREELGSVAGATTSDSLKYRCRLRSGQSYLDEGFPGQSESTLRELLLDASVKDDDARRTQVQFWVGVAALRQANWVEAAGFFGGIRRNFSGHGHAADARGLEQAALEGFRLPGKSPALATGLSMILPGSGQIYSGHILDGLLSLAFNAAAGYLTVDAFQDDRRLDGTLLATLVWSRFYFGGLQNAARHAREYNRRQREEHLKQYQELMKPEYID